MNERLRPEQRHQSHRNLCKRHSRRWPKVLIIGTVGLILAVGVSLWAWSQLDDLLGATATETDLNGDRLSSTQVDGAIENRLREALPNDAYLRDVEAIPGTDRTLAIYVRNPQIGDFDPRNAWTCPGRLYGQLMYGEYHLVLLDNRDVVNDVRIPDTSGLIYRQLESIVKDRDDYRERLRAGTTRLIEVELIRLQDLTGDGKAHQFQLEGHYLACGHHKGLVAGYSAKQNEAVVYPIILMGHESVYWHVDFFPDHKGTVDWHLQCGDHGNDMDEMKTFEFSSELESYLLTRYSRKLCFSP